MAPSAGPNNSNGSITLHGAPDDKIGDKIAERQLPQYICAGLDKDTVNELKSCSKSGGKVEITFGKMPTLSIGDMTRQINISPSTFRSEVYENVRDGKSVFQFKGIVSHVMSVEQNREQFKRTSAAHAVLAAKMKEEQQNRENNQMTFIENDSDVARKAAVAKKKPNFMRPTNNRLMPSQASRSLQSSPKLSASNHSSLQRAPTSDPITTQLERRKKAVKFSLSHFLAIRPSSTKEIVTKTRVNESEVSQFLSKYAREAQTPGLFELNPHAYKDLNIWAFPYKEEEDRTAVQQNAVRAFDRLRVSKDDKVWQSLLRNEDRNRGIVLSKLHLNGTTGPNAAAQGSGTPSVSSPVPFDHRKLLAGAGGEPVSRPRGSSGSNLQRVMNGRKPLSGKLSPMPAAKPASSPSMSGKTTKDRNKPAHEIRTGKSNSSTRKAEPKEYKSAEFVNDDDDLSENDLGIEESSVKPQVQESKRSAREHDMCKKALSDAPKTGSKRVIDDSERLEHGGGSSTSTLPDSTAKNEAKRLKLGVDSPRPSIHQKTDQKTGTSSASNTRDLKKGTPRPSQTMATPDHRPQTVKGAPHTKKKDMDSSRATTTAPRTQDRSAPDLAKVSVEAKQSTGGQKFHTAGQAGQRVNQFQRHDSRPSSQLTPKRATTTVSSTSVLSRTVIPSSSDSEQRGQQAVSRLEKEPTALSSSSASSTTSSTSRTSVFSPATIPDHRPSGSISSLASSGPGPKIKATKASELKRPGSSQGFREQPLSQIPSTLSSKRRKMSNPECHDSSSPLTPALLLRPTGTPSDYHKSPPSSSEKQYRGVEPADTPGARSRASSGTSSNKETLSTPYLPASSADTPDLADASQVAAYHALQAKYLPLFRTSLHINVTLGLLPSYVQTDADRERCNTARSAMAAVMEEMKTLVKSMSPSTLTAIGQDPDDVARRIRLDNNEKSALGCYEQWDVLPADFRVDDVPGFYPYARTMFDVVNPEYEARKVAWEQRLRRERREPKAVDPKDLLPSPAEWTEGKRSEHREICVRLVTIKQLIMVLEKV